MGAQDNLGHQFPRPGDVKDIGGQPHSFAGYHMTHDPNFKPDPNYEHFDNNNMYGAEKGGMYVSHGPNYWGPFMEHEGHRSHAVEAWEPVQSKEHYQSLYPHLSPETNEGMANHHVPEMAHMSQYHGAIDQRVVYPGKDAVVGRTHEFNDALKQHVESYTTNDDHANHLALGPGPRVRQKISRGEDGKLHVQKWTTNVRAFGGR